MIKRTYWKKEFDDVFMCHALVIEQAKKIAKENSKTKALKFLKDLATKHKTWKIRRAKA